MAGIRSNAISGITSSQIEASYTTSPITATQLGSPDFPFSNIKDALVSVIGRIIRAYASVPNHPFRTYNLSQTDDIAHKGLIPSVDSAGKPIIGVYGAIRDSSDGEALTEMPEQIISGLVTNPDTFLKGDYYGYKIVSDRLHHTRDNAVIDVVTFSASDILTGIGADGNAPIPDACLDIAWTGLVSTLFIDDEFIQQSQMCGNYFGNALDEIRSGAASFAPAPVLVSSQAPAVS